MALDCTVFHEIRKHVHLDLESVLKGTTACFEWLTGTLTTHRSIHSHPYGYPASSRLTLQWRGWIHSVCRYSSSGGSSWECISRFDENISVENWNNPLTHGFKGWKVNNGYYTHPFFFPMYPYRWDCAAGVNDDPGAYNLRESLSAWVSTFLTAHQHTLHDTI